MALFTPEFGLIFWMLVVFLILLGILAKYAWPVIIKSMEERAEFIDSGVRITQEAIQKMEQAKIDARAMMAEAHKKQMQELQETERLKRQMIADARDTAGLEAKKMMDAAKLSVEQSKKEAELQLRRQVGLLSLQIAEKVIRKDLSTDQAQVEMIDKFLNEIEHEN